MSIWSILYNILIMPLQLFFETLFMMANRIINNPGLSIIVLSLAMNFLVLPLYRRADAMQEEERDMEAKLHKGVKHIKKTFKGDERMMILNTYYRQKKYKPTYVFRGAISLFLEIPFFIAAYQFLSHLELLQGVAFGPLHDLGAADALLTVGSFHINVLPIIMTAVNLVSCVIFTKGYPTKTKVQLYSMAIFFFFFLYSSPSGLVFYWTLNNLFSLVKTIFYKLKHAKQILQGMFATAGVILIAAAFHFFGMSEPKRLLGVSAIGVICLFPLLIAVIKKYCKPAVKAIEVEAMPKVFLAGAVFLVVLIGILIPSAVIKSSPQEFVDVYCYSHPLWYVCSSCCLAIGTFVVWMGVFYWLADKKFKVYFEVAVWVLSGIAIVDYMFFAKDMGLISNMLIYEDGMSFTAQQQLINAVVILLVAVVLVTIYRFGKKFIPQVLLIASMALFGMSIGNVISINASISKMQGEITRAKENNPTLTLSKTGKNVIVFMLDRGMNELLPYLMNERPELKEMFSGFTYYDNTLSFGPYTNFGTPALFGGYEYTPFELNKRDTESLMSKQNEALKVMPVLFDENGYKVTVCDPIYANYQYLPDTSIYDEYPDIDAYVTFGRYLDEESKEAVIVSNKRNFFCYSIMKSAPLCIQPTLYNAGSYNHYKKAETVYSADGQTAYGNSVAEGLDPTFMGAYTVLQNLPSITNVTDDSQNTFLMMTNDTAHDTILLQEPEYEPAAYVDNTEFDAEHEYRYTEDGKSIQLQNRNHLTHYQVNMAALLKIGEWLDYLKENGVYDNTRIIIAADHGRALYLQQNMILGFGDLNDAEFYYPLLMVKDFDSDEFTTSDEFMTNGDVPTLATEGLIDDPINPFTGKEINNNEKYAHEQYVIGSEEFDVKKNCGNQYNPAMWFAVHDDVRKAENWTLLQESAVFPVNPEGN